jgi:hypothetical protein
MGTSGTKRDAIEKATIGADDFPALLEEVKQTPPEQLVESNALGRAIQHKATVLRDYQLEQARGGVTATTQNDFNNAITLVATVAAIIPKETRAEHLVDPVVADIQRREPLTGAEIADLQILHQMHKDSSMFR